MDWKGNLQKIKAGNKEFTSQFYYDVSNALSCELDVQDAKLLAEIVAEACKQDEPRKAFEEFNLVADLVTIISRYKCAASIGNGDQTNETSLDQACIQSLRALANLCFDNDANREQLLNVDSTPILDLFDACATVQKTLLGALLNISMDNELIQSKLVDMGILEKISSLLQSYLDKGIFNLDNVEVDSFVLIIRVLANLLESDVGLNQFFQSNLVHQVNQVLEIFKEYLTNTSKIERFEFFVEAQNAIGVLLETVAEIDQGQILIAPSVLFYTIVALVDCVWSPLILSSEPPKISELCETLILMAKIVSLITMNDANMEKLCCTEFIEKAVPWLHYKSNFSVLEEDVRMYGALCIGNIARSDQTCGWLMSSPLNVYSSLATLMKHEKSRLGNVSYQKTETKLVLKVIHAVVGAIKNLSLAEVCREPLGEAGCISDVCSLIALNHGTLLHTGIISIVKSLCAGMNDRNVYRVLTGLEPKEKELIHMDYLFEAKCPLAKIVNLVWNVSKEDDGGVRNEGGRLVANIIKCIYRNKDPRYIQTLKRFNSITLVVQILTGAYLTKPTNNSQEIIVDHHVHFDAPAEHTKVFPLVQNESLVALVQVISMDEECAVRLVKHKESVSVTLRNIMESEEEDSPYTPETKINVCLLLYLVFTKFPDYARVEKNTVVPILEHVLAESLKKQDNIEKDLQDNVQLVLDTLNKL